MTSDLSAFYFDIRKDALYCDPVSSVTRKACLTVLDQIFRCTVTWLAPMLCFSAEEAWLSRYGNDAPSVHLQTFPEIPAAWRDDALADKWRKVRLVRRVVTGALELERAQKRIGSSLEAAPVVYVADKDLFAALGRCRSRRNLHHLGRDTGGRRGPGRCVPSGRDARRRGRAEARAREKNARAPGRCSKASAPIPIPGRVAARRAGLARMGSHAQGGGIVARWDFRNISGARIAATASPPRCSSACSIRPPSSGSIRL